MVAINENIKHGKKTVTASGTAEALSTSFSCSQVTIKALAANTNNIYVGNSAVETTDGYVLDAGEEVTVLIDDLSKVFIDADTNGEGVTFISS